jgi:hypothetical protein
MMITLDPDTAEKTPAILKAVAQAHEGMAVSMVPCSPKELFAKGTLSSCCDS